MIKIPGETQRIYPAGHNRYMLRIRIIKKVFERGLYPQLPVEQQFRRRQVYRGIAPHTFALLVGRVIPVFVGKAIFAAVQQTGINVCPQTVMDIRNFQIGLVVRTVEQPEIFFSAK